jgi:hypothetical protein
MILLSALLVCSIVLCYIHITLLLTLDALDAHDAAADCSAIIG